MQTNFLSFPKKEKTINYRLLCGCGLFLLLIASTTAIMIAFTDDWRIPTPTTQMICNSRSIQASESCTYAKNSVTSFVQRAQTASEEQPQDQSRWAFLGAVILAGLGLALLIWGTILERMTKKINRSKSIPLDGHK